MTENFVMFGDCFNTQPPEGGWSLIKTVIPFLQMFQHTAARRRLDFL